MKKIVSLFLFASLILTSCEKIDSSLIGNWKLAESKYLITAAEDFTFVDVYGSSWQGIIKIDNKEFNPSLFNYYFDSSTGQNHFASQELLFTFMGPILVVRYQNTEYLLEKENTFNIKDGIYKTEGTAAFQDESIEVYLDLTMPKVPLKKGEQFSVRDAYNNIPYYRLMINGSGKLQTDYIVGDIIETLSGKWNTDNNNLNISVKNRAKDAYQYDMNANSLLLSKDKTTEEMNPPHISPFTDKISKITYQALYMRE